MSFQRAMSSGFSLCCRATSAWLFVPERTSRTTWALNSAVKDRRLRLGIGGRSWEASMTIVLVQSQGRTSQFPGEDGCLWMVPPVWISVVGEHGLYPLTVRRGVT